MDLEIKTAVEDIAKDINSKLAEIKTAQENLDGKLKVVEEKSANNEELGEFKSNLEESNKALESLASDLTAMMKKQASFEMQTKDAAQIIVEQEGLVEHLKEYNRPIEVKDITTAGFPTHTVSAMTRTDNLGMVAPINQKLFLRDILPTISTEAPNWVYVQELLFTNNAAVVPEGTQKPQSEITLEAKTGTVKKIAHSFKVSEEALDDTDGLEGYIRERGIFGLRKKEEEQLLFGNGSVSQLDGLTNTGHFTLYDNKTVPGHTVAARKYLDDLRVAIAQVEEADLSADVIVMNHLDAAKLQLDKDADGRWLHPAFTGNSAWGLPMVTTKGLAQGKFLVMGTLGNVMIRDRKAIEIRRSTEDGNNFITNMVTILIESRLGLEVIRPQAVIYGTFTTA